MAITYSPNLKLTLIGTGDQAGTWGNTTNTNLGTLIEQAIAGYVSQTVADSAGSPTSLSIADGTDSVARNMNLVLQGALTAPRDLILPTNKKLYFITNNTSGGHAVTVKCSGQTGVSIPSGAKAVLACNGTDIVEAFNYSSSLIFPSSATIANLAGTNLVYSSATLGNVFASGNVGIGTSSPWEKLSIPFNEGIALGSSTYSYKVTRSGAGDLVTTFSDTYNSNDARVDFTMKAGAVTPLSIRGNGNIGIGTTAPEYNLDIQGAAGVCLKLFENSSGGSRRLLLSQESTYVKYNATYGSGGNGHSWWVGGTRYMDMDNSGNVGIGTSSPATKLHVSDSAGSTFAGTFRGSGGSNLVAIGTTSFGASINAYTSGFAATADLVLQPNGGNVGIGTTPSAWSGLQALQLPNFGTISTSGDSFWSGSNFYYESGTHKYISNGFATKHTQAAGTYTWYTASSGTAGSAITFNQVMTLNNSGNFGVGVSSIPNVWSNGFNAIQVNGCSLFANGFNNFSMATNLAGGVDGGSAGGTYGSNSPAAKYQQIQGVHNWYNAPSGTIGNAITFTNAMSLDSNSNLTVTGNVYAPIYYDSNNSSYYLDPANTGTALTVAGNVGIGTTDTSYNKLNIGNDSASSATIGLSFTTAQTERAEITMSGDTGLMNITSGYTGYGGKIAFNANGGTRMYIDTTGYVGIGTSSPGANLEVSSSSDMFRLRTSSARGAGNGYFSFWDTTGRKSYIGYGASDDAFYVNNEVNAPILFATNSTERMRIAANGSVGIGGAPDSSFALDVRGEVRIINDVGSNYGGSFRLYNSASGATNPSKVFRISPTGTLEIINSAFTAVRFQFTDTGEFVAESNITGAAFYDVSNSAYYLDPGNTSTSLNVAGSISLPNNKSLFFRNAANTNSASFILQSDDNFVVYNATSTPIMSFGQGTSPLVAYGANSNNRMLVNGSTNVISFNTNGTEKVTIDSSGNVVATGNVTAYSDIRVKDNIEDITDAVDKLSQIRGVTYTRIDLDDKERKYAGVIAQEIEQVLPEAVFDNGKVKSVDYNATIALLIEAVKEQQAQINELKLTVQQLKGN